MSEENPETSAAKQPEEETLPDPAIKILIFRFIRDFDKNMKKAQACGALSGIERPVDVARCVLAITAAKFAPESKSGKALLGALRYFI